MHRFPNILSQEYGIEDKNAGSGFPVLTGLVRLLKLCEGSLIYKMGLIEV